MHVTIIRHSIRNRGGDKVISDYAKYLLQQGYVVDYYTNEIKSSTHIDQALPTKQIPYKGKAGTIRFALSEKLQTDVVLVDIVAMAVFSWFRNRKKVVYLAQDYDVSYYSSAFMQTLLKALYWIAFRLMRIPVIVESQSLLDRLLKFKPQKHIISSVGIDLDFYKFESRTKYFEEKSHKFVILLAVWEDYRKGIDIGVKALQKLNTIRPEKDWEVWAIGEKLPPMDGIPIKNFGFLKPEDLKDILSTATIYLMPSRSEGLSLLLLNALACQCVVVGTEATNILTDKITGLISPINDWIALAANLNLALSDEQLRSKISLESRKLAMSYDLKECKLRFAKALKDFTVDEAR